jgi:exopolyphosphatase/guanosine-5'-triphosphate,3'-diphosphate pyrophosphatase
MTPDTPSSGASTPIHPRWEWRTFGASFPEAERRLAELDAERTRESDEVYVVSVAADGSAKFRDGVMDVKRLERVDDAGLELWRPVAKAAVPLSAEDAAQLLDALDADGPAPARTEYTMETFVAELVEPNPRVQAIPVHKRRRHFTVGGCMTELTELRTAQGSTRTIAVEAEDPALVAETVRALGLEGRRNVNVPRGLGALVGFGGRRYAVIDVGTNSVKFHVGERGLDGAWRTVADRAEVTRLGEGLDAEGRLGAEPIARTAAAIEEMVQEARRDGVEEIAAVGTAWMRAAANSAELVAAVRERDGVDVGVVSGDDEARLAYQGVLSALDVGDGAVVVFDTGGGSSQFTFGRGEDVEERFSVPVGAARFTERFGLDGPVSDETLADARAAIAADLSRLDGRRAAEAVVGMGGAVTNLAAVRHELAAYDAAVVQGSVLEAAEIDRQIELYRTRTADERRGIVGLQPKRAEVILAGACIVRTVLERLGASSLTVSDRGLRHGLIRERFPDD